MTRPRVAVAILLFALGCKKPVQPGDPLSGLFEQQLERFTRGKLVFDSVFTPATGLGPLFNSVACGECHEKPAGGRGDEVEVHATAFRGGVCDPLVQEGGPVIQRHAIPALKQALGIDSEPFPPSATARALRTSPVVFGRGLLDFVPDSVILAYADPDDKDHDGVRGRPNRFVDGRMGRFGRKAFVPTLREFNAGAFVAEMGVTDPAQPTEENIGGKPIPAGVDAVADPELSQEAFNLTDDFVRFLAPPTPLKVGQEGRRGRQLFSQIGCAACHRPTLRTGPRGMPAFRNREFAGHGARFGRHLPRPSGAGGLPHGAAPRPAGRRAFPARRAGDHAGAGDRAARGRGLRRPRPVQGPVGHRPGRGGRLP